MFDLVTLNGLQERLRLPRDWLKAEAEGGRLPCLRIGRRLLFNADAVRAELARRASSVICATCGTRIPEDQAAGGDRECRYCWECVDARAEAELQRRKADGQ